MNKTLMATAALMLTMLLAVSCKKDKTPTPNTNPTTTVTPEAVDLGLPSGTLWATFNLGANAPEEFGAYIAWGETQGKASYSWSNYKYCQDGDSLKMTKYCNEEEFGNNGFTDTLWCLTSSDDAATKQWGSEWCTPTYEQWKELMRECENDVVVVNGVGGNRYTGPNGKSIFLPAAGSYDGTSLINVRVSHNYWSSTLTGYSTWLSEGSGPHMALAFHANGSLHYMQDYYRYKGYSVRPVKVNK